MRRVLRYSISLLLLPVLLAGALLLFANTGTGQRLIAWGLGELSGGRVVLSGLSGTLPWAPRIERLELHDGDGAWLVVEDARLDLAPLQLLGRKAAIQDLFARSVVLRRLPSRDQQAAEPIKLPVRVLLQRLFIEDLAIDQLVPGAPRLTIEGSGSVASAADAQATLLITAPGRGDRYHLALGIDDGHDRLTLALQEDPGGLVAALASLTGVQVPAGLDGWRLDAKAEGPRSALALTASLEAELGAGPLQAAAEGLLDLESRSATELRLSADLPAMTLAPGDSPAIAWRRMGVKADLTGPFLAPQGHADLELDAPSAGEITLDRLTATVAGDLARLRIDAGLHGLRAPGLLPETVAAVPLRVTGDLTLDDPALPFRLTVAHPLLDLAAEGGVTARSAQATLTLPDLASLAAPGVDLAGRARFDLKAAADGDPQLDATGELALTRAPGPRPELVQDLLGPAARIELSVRRDGDAWRVTSAQVEGARIKVAAQGRVGSDALALGWTLELPDLSVLGPGWSGRLEARGDVAGDPAAPGLVADLALDAGHPDAGRGRVSGRLEARLAEPGGSLDLSGDWAGQPVAVNLRAARFEDGGLSLSFGDSRWASVKASGSLRLASGATLPQGTMRFSAERLADLDLLIAPWVGSASGPGLAGRLSADLTLTDTGMAQIEAEGQGLRLPGPVEIGTLALSARVTEPLGTAETQATLRLDGLTHGQVSGDLFLTARGTARAMDLTADAGLRVPAGPVKLAAGARLDAPARRLALQRLKAQIRGETLSLLAPAVLDFADGLAVDRLRLGLRPGGTQASVEIAGRVLPRLDLTGTLAGLPLDLMRLVAPDLPLAGTLAGTLGADLRLTGTLDAPLGRLRAQASGLRLTQGPGRAIPPAQVNVTLDLAPDGAQIDAQAETDARTNLRIEGRVAGRPPFTSGALSLRADGRVDLGLLDPVLTSGGRQLSGGALLNTAVTGTLAAPRLDGTLRLTDAALRDRTLGLALTGVEGTLVLAGDTLRLERLAGQSGRGTVELTGSVGVLAPGLPVDLRLVARDARPIQLDQLDVQGDADLRLSGNAAERLTAAGTVRLSRLEVRLPDRLPATIATLQVSERGGAGRPAAAGPAAPAWSPDLALDLALSAPRGVTVRGRGIDAELGGEVRLRGTLAEPIISGGFDLLQGQYELVGQVLRFTRGRIGFDGAHGIDPTLDLEARATAAGSTAILAVLGTAGKPRIELRGEPPLPQDEVLSRLLFGVAGGRLSPLQATRLGLAATSLAGIGGGEGGGLLGLGVLDRLRTGLGLERLSLGTDAQGGATVEGGRQITDRIYVGARQGARAGEPQGVLRIGITPRIKLEADIGATGGTRAGAAYEREY